MMQAQDDGKRKAKGDSETEGVVRPHFWTVACVVVSAAAITNLSITMQATGDRYSHTNRPMYIIFWETHLKLEPTNLKLRCLRLGTVANSMELLLVIIIVCCDS
jgi:hypothetical protein